MQKNRFLFGVRTPRVVQDTDDLKLSTHTTTRVEVGFTVTKKKAGKSLWGQRELLPGTLGAVGCRSCAMLAKELRRICGVSES